MKRLLAIFALTAILASCTAAPTPPASVTLPHLSHTPSTTPGPLSRSTLPATWTPVPDATNAALPAYTPAIQATHTPTARPGRWDPNQIPDITLTPTPTDWVPAAAQRAHTAARSAFVLGDFEGALAHLDQALALAPENSDFLALRGQVLIALGHPLDGESNLREALAFDPFHAGARWALAELYASYQYWRYAEAEYGRYLMLSPADPAGWFAIGWSREKLGQPLTAIAAYSSTLELDPQYLDGLERRAALWLQQESFQAAWEDYSALIAAAPSAAAHEARGNINLELEQPLLAALDFEAALSLLPAGTPTFTLLMQAGQAYLTGGAAAQAVVNFTSAISLTTSVEPRLLLGESYLALADFSAAKQVYSNTLALARPVELGQVLSGRGRAWLGEGQFDQAIGDLTAALSYAKSPAERAAMLAWRGATYAGLEQYSKAIADLTAAYKLAPDPVFLYQRGVLYQSAGDVERASADLTAFLEADEDDLDPDLLLDAQSRLDDLAAASP